MEKWNKQLEEEITLLIKDWLKQKGKTQKDLSKYLKISSERMPAILETLKTEFSSGGIPSIARVLCSIDAQWANRDDEIIDKEKTSDPFGQLDLLLEEINQDCNN